MKRTYVRLTDDTPERIQKVLAAAGIASRRQLEAWIKAGRIAVNGVPASLGQKITRSDQVKIDDKPVSLTVAQQVRVLAYNKPIGEICTRYDPDGRATIFDRLPKLRAGRWINVGRLDLNSSGLILLTTDGQLADALMRPASGIAREYHVRVLGTVSESMLTRLQKGLQLEDGPARFESVEARHGKGANRWYACRLREGRNREVRRLWEAVGCQVNRLIRTRYGSVRLPRDLLPGQSRELDTKEIATLHRAAGLGD
ncbi:MAG: pseudouridine synthase [Gammaproteobacteria bacterium]|nr:pseudouridine synthase [Gammaproteobacteria bacterium]